MLKPTNAAVFLLVASFACGGTSSTATTTPPAPTGPPEPKTIEVEPEEIVGTSRYPAAPRQDVVDEIHGTNVADPYRWLEDANAPEVTAWLDANDQLTRSTIAGLPYRAKLAERFKSLLYLDSVSAPTVRGKRYFYTRRHKDKEKPIVYWRDGDKGEEKVLIDPHALSDDGTSSLGGWYPTRDGKLVAYKVKANNADESILYVRTVATGEDSKVDVLQGVKYSGASWLPDGKGFYYTFLPSGPDISVADRPGYAEVRFHRIGTEQSADELVFPRTGSAQTFIGGGVSRDGRWLLVTISHGWNAQDVYFKDLKKKARKPAKVPELAADAPLRDRLRNTALEQGFTPLVVGQDAKYDVTVWKNKFYVRTNEGAPKYKVWEIDPKRADRKRWKEIVPEGETPIDSVAVIGGKLVVTYTRNAVTEIEVRDLRGKPVRKLELPSIGYAKLQGDPELDEAYYSFSSFTEPTKIFKTSMKSGKSELWEQIEIPLDLSNVEVKQVWYESKDGTKVPMFIVHKQGITLDGNNPTILYGYGGFNVIMRPYFSAGIANWVDMGGVWVTANLRGGGELGEEWHKAGMLLNKQNVFDDYIAAAEYLAREGYASKDKLAIYGGSNGGLLVGAAMTQRPELFKAVVCGVPLLDMVRYHLFGSGKTWVPEYGSAEDPAQFEVLYNYSPYHRVKQGVKYPALLMMASANDDRVDPMHARKFTAAVQWASEGDNPALIRVERHAGHGGADLIKADVERYADLYSFLVWQLGLEPTP